VAPEIGETNLDLIRSDLSTKFLRPSKFLDKHWVEWCAMNKVNNGLDAWGRANMSAESLMIGLNKYNRPEYVPNMEALDFADFMMTRKLENTLGQTDALSFDEVLSDTDKTTSPGYPLNEQFKTKQEACDDLMQFERLKKAVEDNDLLTQPHTNFKWFNSLKCEIRDIERVVQKKTRVFTASPMLFTLLSSVWCSDFNQKFYDASAKLSTHFFSTVGFTDAHLGWHRLFTKLNFFPNGFDLDESSFDASHNSFFAWRIARLRAKLFSYQDEAVKSLAKIYLVFQQSRVVSPTGVEHRKQFGLPTGGVNTIVDNTIFLYMLLCYSWFMLAPKNKLYQMDDNVRLALNGDDNTFSVSDDAVSFFNAQSVALVWGSIGVKATAENGWDPKPISKCMYLSRRFDVHIDDFVVPYYPFEKTRASLAYSKHPVSRGYALVRAVGIYNTIWCNEEARKILKQYIDWLKAEPREDDPWWQVGLNAQMSDVDLIHLYLSYQSFPGSAENKMPGKRKNLFHTQGVKIMNNEKIITTIQTNASRSGNNRSRRQARKAARQNSSNRGRPANQQGGKKSTLAQRQRQAQKAGRGNRSFNKKNSSRTFYNPLTDAIGLANSFLNPLDAPPPRLNAAFGGNPTGVAALQSREVISYRPYSDSSQAFVFRSALRRSLISFNPNWAEEQVVYSNVDNQMAIPPTGDAYYFHLPLVALATNVSFPHGTVLYPGTTVKGTNGTFFLMNPGDTFSFGWTSWVTGQSLILEFNAYEGGQVQQAYSQLMNTAGPWTWTYSGFVPIYVQVAVRTPLIGAGVPILITAELDLEVNGIADAYWHFGQLPLPNLDSNVPAIDNLRVIGASLMYTNTSQTLVTGGQVAIAQLPQGEEFTQYLGFNNIAALQKETMKVQPAATGAYAFLKPTSGEDFFFLDEFSTTTLRSSTSIPYTYWENFESVGFLLESPFSALTVAVSLPIVTGATALNGLDGYYTIVHSVEYESTDQWRSLQFGRVGEETLDAALAIIATAPQFHPNDWHIDDIVTYLKGVLKDGAAAIKKYGPQVIDVIQRVITVAGTVGAIAAL